MPVRFPVWLLVALQAPSTTPVDLLRRVEERAQKTTSLMAEFEQTYQSAALGRELKERGTLRIKRPSRMLWEYAFPEKKLFVSDGKTFYFYVPSERQVVVREQSGERGVAMSLLAGGAGMLTQFNASFDDTGGARRLRLTPKAADPEVEHLLVDVDADARIVGLEVYDAQGNRSHFRFEKLRENVVLDDRLFHFEVPKGVSVVSG
jgi:outer membrane lipoprotein carrier protein